MKKIILLTYCIFFTIAAFAQINTYYIDFGPNDVTNGNITTSPDVNGNYWNNLIDPSNGSTLLVNKDNSSSNITLKVSNTLASNGIQNGGLLSPDPTLLNDFAIATATQDYFFTTGSGKLQLDSLDPTKAYVFNLFASRSTTSTRETQYIIEGTNSDTTNIITSGTNIGANGYNGNNNNIAVTSPIRPDATGRITIEVSVIQGTFGYIGLMRMDEVEYENPTFLVDFGPNDGTNGNITTSPDINGNYWNNMTNGSANQATISLVSSKNTNSSAYLTVTQNFSTNGIQNGGLLAPTSALLNDFAIATATQDYFFTGSNTGSLEIGGLDTASQYIFSLFGTRNTSSTRITNYTLVGSNTFSDTLTTSGTNIGALGYNGNNNNILVTDTISPTADGKITIDVSTVTGNFSYLGCLQMEMITPIKQPQPPCVIQDTLGIAVMGSSVANGVGATNNEGYAFRYTQLLANRHGNGLGADWNVTNISIGGNNTVNVQNRFENDLLPLCPKYVIYGLSLANEGLMTQGQAAFDQFETNMLALIADARSNGIEPIVVNCYANGSFNATHYNFTKQMNLLIHEWDVASINSLGGIDDGTGKWAQGYDADPGHPNSAGHTEMFYTIVPSLFDALTQGKPQPTAVAGTYLNFDKSAANNQIEFTPEEIVHPFTFSFDIRTAGNGVIGGFMTDNGASAGLSINANGTLDYNTDTSTHFTGTTTLNDSNWHQVTLTHYYAWGKTLLYVDGVLQGSINEQLETDKFILSAENGPSADYRDLLFYRSGMSPDEISAMVNGNFLKSSLEIYAPLDGQGVLGNDVFINLAQSLNIVIGTTATQYITSTKHIDLQQNTKFNIFPNPIFESTNIRFELSNQSDIQLTIIDVNGREIAMLANEKLPSGEYHYTWSKANLPSGIYYCILNVNGKRLIKKLILQN